MSREADAVRWLWKAWRLGGTDRWAMERSYFDFPCIAEAQERQRMCNEALSVGVDSFPAGAPRPDIQSKPRDPGPT